MTPISLTPEDKTRQALERQAAPQEERTIENLIARMAPQIEKALPAQIGAERFARIVLTEVRRNPALRACTPESLLGALMLSAQLGLEPGPLGHVYLIPWKEKGLSVVQFIIGYRGMIDLARRSGGLRDIVARTVYEHELFEYEERETGPRLRHRLLPPAERGEIRCHYARAGFTSGGRVVQVLYPEEIEAHRRRSPAARREAGPWLTDYEAMARKTVIRAMAPWLPLNPVAMRGVSVDEQPVTGYSDEGPEVEAKEEGE